MSLHNVNAVCKIPQRRGTLQILTRLSSRVDGNLNCPSKKEQETVKQIYRRTKYFD